MPVRKSGKPKGAAKPPEASVMSLAEKARSMVDRAEQWDDYFQTVLGVVLGDAATPKAVSTAADLADRALEEYEERWKGV